MGIFTRFSLKNVVVIFLVIVLVIIGGVYSAGNISKEAMPNINFPVISVTTVYPLASPQDVDEGISKPLQKAVSGVNGVNEVDTYSNDNVSILIARFDYSQDMDKAQRDVEDAVNKVTLPDKSQKPSVGRYSFGGFAMMKYTVSGLKNVDNLGRVVNDKVIPELSGINGVANVSLEGTRNNNIYIKVNPDKLKANGMTLQDLQTALSSNDITIPTGQINVDSNSLLVRVSRKINGLNDIKSIPIMVAPNTSKMLGQTIEGVYKSIGGLYQAVGGLGQAVGGLGQAVGQMGQSMGQIGQGVGALAQGEAQLGQGVAALGKGQEQIGKGMTTMGQLVGNNTQAIALLTMIQQNEINLLKQKEIASSSTSTPTEKLKANVEMLKSAQVVMGLEKSLSDLLKKSSELGKSAMNGQNTKNQQGAVSKPNGAFNGGSASINSMKGLNGGLSGQSGSKASNSLNKLNELKKLQSLSNMKLPSGTASVPSLKSAGSNSLKIVFLSDVAEVTEGNAETSSYTRSNGKDALVLNVYKTDEANTMQVAADVRTKLNELKKTNENIKFDKIQDSSEEVKTSINGMMREGILGAIFAVIVIALFLRELRATIIAIVSIPLSILIAMIVLPQFNITINIMSLGGIAVAVGRIVDDSIVVIENIYRRIQLGDLEDEKLIETAAAEVSSAITSSTITTVAVFLPLAMVSGIIGKIFVPFALTVVICILASLLVALTVVPTLSKLLILKVKPKEHKASRLQNIYEKVIRYALSHRLTIIISSVILIVVSMIAATRIGIQFLPSSNSNIINASVSLKAGTSLDETNNIAEKFEKYLYNNKNVATVLTSVGNTTGAKGGNLSMQGTNQASFTIILKDKVNIDKALSEIRDKANSYESSSQKWNVAAQNISGSKDTLGITVNGNNVNDISLAADKITKALKNVKDIANISNNIAAKKKEVLVSVDSYKAAQKGLNPIIVAGTIRNMLNYDKVTTVQNNGKDVEVDMGLDEKSLNSIDAVKNMQITGALGAVKLSDIANVTVHDVAVTITEKDGRQYASISADVMGNDTSGVTKAATKEIDKIKSQFPKGVTYSTGGSMKDISSGFSQMGMAILVAIFLVYIIMVLAFGEATAPLAILFSLPFAAVGGLLALAITGQALGMTCLIGMLMLIGIVVTNAIVLVDRVQKNRKLHNMTIEEALIEAGKVRLRPIFMTAIATIMALIPMAIGMSEGELLSQGLGIVVIGGLTLSTVLTLIIVPVMYSYLEGFKMKILKG